MVSKRNVGSLVKCDSSPIDLEVRTCLITMYNRYYFPELNLYTCVNAINKL